MSGIGLPRSLDEFRFRDVAVFVVVGLTIWGYVDIGPHGRIVAGHPEWHKTDFTVYTEAASAILDGRDPYRVTNPRGWYYLYPPLFALAVAPLTAFDTESQVLAWFAINAALAFACYGEARRLWRLLAPDPASGRGPLSPRWAAVAAFAAVLLPTLDCFQRGQVGVLLLYLLMLGFRLVVQSRGVAGRLAGGLVLALPAVLKLVPILPVGFLLGQLWLGAIRPGRGREARHRASAATIGLVLGAALFLLAIPSSAVGWRKNLDYLRTWTVRIAANEEVGRNKNFDIHSPRNQSLSNAVHQWIDPERSALGRPIPPRATRWAPLAGRVLQGMALLVLAAVGLRTGLRGRPLDLATGYGLACVATLLLSPIAWGHYFMIELPALLALSLRPTARRHAAAGRLLLWTPAALALTHYVLLKHVGGLGLLGLGTTLWFFAAGVVALLPAEAPTGGGRAATIPKRTPMRTPRRGGAPKPVFYRAWVPLDTLQRPL